MILENQKDSTTAVKHISGSGEENDKLLASKDLKQDENIAAKKDLSKDEESKQSDARQTINSLKENVEGVQATYEDKDKVSTKETSTKEDFAENSESKEDKEVDKRDIKVSQKMQADEKLKTEALTGKTNG